MASLETAQLDRIIAGRRAMLGNESAAPAGSTFANAVFGADTVTSYTDNDILNFALNLEYLEANFYYLAAFGTTIDKPNGASIAAGGPSAGIPITGTGKAGTVLVKGSPQVPFSTVQVGSYCTETAIEEGKHVLFLQSALGKNAVAQPPLDLQTSFNTLATAASLTAPFASPFDPFASDISFLIGAYIFEDVGVSAYHGAAPLISASDIGKTYLAAAAGIHAVEAYHAGLIRTTILALDPTGSMNYLAQTVLISSLRAALAAQLPQTPANPNDPSPDDYGVSDGTFIVTLGSSGMTMPRTNIVDADPLNVEGFARSTTQVLNIVTGGGATTTGMQATGLFFPSGLNGTFA